MKTQLPIEMKDKAYKICREFLSGSWKNISSQDMVFKTVSGGMSNILYFCSLPETHTPLNGEPSQVLFRMYGQLHDGKPCAKITDSVIFMLLSERKLGPQLYGIFPEGRLEEYIPARALTCQQLTDPEISATIARKLARVHGLQVPLKKEPTWLFDRMYRWLEHVKNNVYFDKIPYEKRDLAEKLLNCDFEREIEWLRSFLQKISSPVVFCHNDLQEERDAASLLCLGQRTIHRGNILLPQENSADEDRVVFIDFEFCSYNYRGFDLANHFCEWSFDYSNPDYPYFYTKLERFPTKQQQLHFIHNYLSSLPDWEGRDKSLDTEEQLLKEVAAFSLASHLLWTIWGIFSADTSKINFGYWEYAEARLRAYFLQKAKLINQGCIKRKQCEM